MRLSDQHSLRMCHECCAESVGPDQDTVGIEDPQPIRCLDDSDCNPRFSPPPCPRFVGLAMSSHSRSRSAYASSSTVPSVEPLATTTTGSSSSRSRCSDHNRSAVSFYVLYETESTVVSSLLETKGISERVTARSALEDPATNRDVPTTTARHPSSLARTSGQARPSERSRDVRSRRPNAGATSTGQRARRRERSTVRRVRHDHCFAMS